MKDKVLIFKEINIPQVYEINEALEEENKQGWKVVSVRTEAVPFGERIDEYYGRVPMHIFYITTVLLEFIEN